MVLTVKVAVAGVPLDAGVTAGALQVGAGTTAGVIEQENATLELKPPTDVTVMVEVTELPAEMVEGLKAVPEMVKVGMRVKVAVTEGVVLFAIATEHVPVPEQPPPLQPVKVELVAGVAVSVTVDPAANPTVHVLPQLMPLGELVIVPTPVPARVAVRGMGGLKFAVTVWLLLSVMAQGAVPEQPEPLQPANVEAPLGVAVRVI